MPIEPVDISGMLELIRANDISFKTFRLHNC